MARVVVGLSGGVDSSVAAWLLKEQGHDVIGLFMRNWNDASPTLEDECPWIDDSRDAMLVAEQLNIPFQILDLSADYKTRIVDYMFAEYAAGRTPNPDVLCNREIKFDLFLQNALKLGADYVATGHYVRKDSLQLDGMEYFRLLQGKDPNKDQSYFLCQLNQEQLSKALFPIGHLQKNEVREIAEKAGLHVHSKKDSQGLCFIGKVSLPDFLQQQLKPKEGDVVLIDRNAPEVLHHIERLEKGNTPEKWAEKPLFTRASGKVIGKHKGAHYYTIGQRRGLHIGGTGLPLFVLQTDVAENIIYVGLGEDHPALMSKALEADSQGIHWVNPAAKRFLAEGKNLKARIRYRQSLFECEIKMTENGQFCVFRSAQRSVTSGQFLAVYFEEELICSATIK
ncbi:MAG: tRNA 2-thiouridine(34) synthase MnmA [Sphingomonadales bacterium]|jgi:tRNA-specific 2-thiouridylase